MPITAKELITSKRAKAVPMPPDEALAELKAVLRHNDKVGCSKDPRWVGKEQVFQLLESWGYKCGKDRLETICRYLGRKSFTNGQN